MMSSPAVSFLLRIIKLFLFFQRNLIPADVRIHASALVAGNFSGMAVAEVSAWRLCHFRVFQIFVNLCHFQIFVTFIFSSLSHFSDLCHFHIFHIFVAFMSFTSLSLSYISSLCPCRIFHIFVTFMSFISLSLSYLSNLCHFHVFHLFVAFMSFRSLSFWYLSDLGRFCVFQIFVTFISLSLSYLPHNLRLEVTLCGRLDVNKIKPTNQTNKKTSLNDLSELLLRSQAALTEVRLYSDKSLLCWEPPTPTPSWWQTVQWWKATLFDRHVVLPIHHQ